MIVRRLTGISSEVINTTSDKITIVKWSLDLSSKANEVRAFGNVYPCAFSGVIWVELYQSMCVTRNWNVDRERSNNCILTDFEKLSYRSQSFSQRNFYSNIKKKIFSLFYRPKLNPFEGLAHAEN